MAKAGFQFWRQERASASFSAAVSTLVHVVLIGAWVAATLPALNPPPEVSERVWYLPPPDPKPARAASTETIRYVELAPEGFGVGMGPLVEGEGVELDLGRRASRSAGNLGRDSANAAAQEAQEGTDSVFTIIQVDTAAQRLPGSAAPRYPQGLLEKRVQGQAIVRFVVDTTGLADPESFSVVVASHVEFAQSVRDALPGMRFSTARIGTLKVRQLVELPFTFNIAAPPPDTTQARAVTTRRPQ